MASEVDICNIALTTLGATTITALDDDVENARKLNEIYEDIRDDLMFSHPWNFATKRAYLDRDGAFIGRGVDDLAADVDDYTGTSPLIYRVQIDAEGTPDTFKWSDDGGSTWDVETVAITGVAQTLNSGVTVTFTATTGHTLSDYWDIAATTIPTFEYEYEFKLPSDYLRKARTDIDRDDYKIEGDYLITSESAIKLEYIALITDATKFSKGFIMALAAKLAAELCYAITNSASLTELKWVEYKTKLSKAKSMDSQESAPNVKTGSNWIDARG